MAGDWIKLVRHPGDAKTARLAELTGAAPEMVFAGYMRWFWWVDENCATERTGITPRNVDGICGIRTRKASMSAAFQDERIDWIEIVDNEVVVRNFSSHFGQGAKRRAMDAERKNAVRKMSASKADNHPQNVRFKSGPEKRREEKSESAGADSPPKPPSERAKPKAAPAGWPEPLLALGEELAGNLRATADAMAAVFAHGNGVVGGGPVIRAIHEVAADQGVAWPEAAAWLLGRIRAYSASPLARTTPQKYRLGLARWCEERAWAQPDSMWSGEYHGGDEAAAQPEDNAFLRSVKP
jgi:hypothetical protein